MRSVVVGLIVVVALGVGSVWQGWAQAKYGSKVRIELSEYSFNPAAITLKAGTPVELEVVNTGKETHMFASKYLGSQDLEVEGGGVEVDAPKGVKYVRLEPGKSVEIKFKPRGKGKFDFSCEMKKDGKPHHALGMKGEITVN